MTKKQKERLVELVNANEQFQGRRIVIDYAISLACEFACANSLDWCELNNEMTNFVEDMYKMEGSDFPTTKP